jgi:hypothetical protein
MTSVLALVIVMSHNLLAGCILIASFKLHVFAMHMQYSRERDQLDHVSHVLAIWW